MTPAPLLKPMSDTPTFANLLTQWSGGGSAARQSVYEHLRAAPADAAALEGAIRHELTGAFAWNRVIAAEAVVAVYGDEPAAASALGWVLRQAEPSSALDAVPIVRKLSSEHAAPLWGELALRLPTVFRGFAPDVLRNAARAAVFAGPDGAGPLLTMLGAADLASEPPLLIGLAEAAPRVEHDLSGVSEWLRTRQPGASYAGGAALWRLTWRVNRAWLAAIDPKSPQLQDRSLLAFLIEILAEHLGRRPDLAPLVRELLLALAGRHYEMFEAVVPDLARFGCGWSVLLPLLSSGASPDARRVVFGLAAARPAVRALAQHHAHAVILARDSDRTAVPNDLLGAACDLLRRIGAVAGSALPDVLNLIVKQPDTARLLAPTVRDLLSGWPLPAAAVARTLDRLRRSVVFAPDAFAALAEVYAELARDSWPKLIDDTSFDPRTVAALLGQPAWASAAPEVRRADALRVADRLTSPRAEVRARAADLIRYYPDRAADVWPAVVALLVAADEHAALLAVPHLRHLSGPAAESATAELKELFGETNAAYAAWAVLALWRIVRNATMGKDLRSEVVVAPGDAWGWAVVRGVVGCVLPGGDPSAVFAAPVAMVAARVHALLNPPELPEETAIGANVRATATGPVGVYWDGVYQCVGNDSEGGLLFLALMCAHGAGGFGAQKIWMIKHQRGLAGTGLAEAKAIVEGAIADLTATARPVVRAARVRDYFRCPPPALPKSLLDLLDHRLSWYRWAALELLDACSDPPLAAPLAAERVWDRSALVRTRALRMCER